MGHPRRGFSFAALFSLLVLTVPAHAWEQDVHYLLTFWLATQAGFSRVDADRIAAGNQSYDDSRHAGAIPTVVLISLTADEGAARSVRDKHFPSDGPLPSPPQRRIVTPNSRSARRAFDAVLADRRSDPDLFILGEALHPFQDSWSHQGVPSTPLGLRPNLSFAHPDSRGGWWRHDADYTHLHVSEVVAVAEESFKLLNEFLRRHSRLRLREAARWETLRPKVQEFAMASTKEGKDAWFTKYLPEESARLALANDDAATLPLPTSVRTQLGFDSGSDAPPDQLVDTAQLMIDAWFSKQDVDLASSFIDYPALLEQFRGASGLVRTLEDARLWSFKLMATQLAADHSAVNEAGHADPNHQRYDELPVAAQRDGPYRAKPPVRVLVRATDFFKASGPGAELGRGDYGLIVTTQSSSTPDEIALVWHRFSYGWRLVRLIVAPA